MWNLKIFDQWRSLLSLKTSVLILFLLIWNLGFVVAMYGFGNGFSQPITPETGVVISIICICTCVFSLAVSFSSRIRAKLLATTRKQDYRAKDFYLLSFVTFMLSIVMFFLSRLTGG